MAGKVYTVWNGKIETHNVIRKTNTGYTVEANWSDKKLTQHIKGLSASYDDGGNINVDWLRLGEVYITESLDQSIEIAGAIQDKLRNMISLSADSVTQTLRSAQP